LTQVLRIILALLLLCPLFSAAQIAAGTYTIGGASPSYATFTAAVADLNTNGLVGDGPVIFDVRDGTYTESLTINQITNANAVNTITFQSENADSTLVILTHASATSTLVLNGADYITFKQMTLQTTGLRRVCQLSGGATNNTFTNCRINGYSTTGSSYSYALFYSTSTATLDTDNKFLNNVMTQGSHAVVFLGSNANTETGMEVSGNEFVNQGGYCLRLNYQDGAMISNNTLTTDRNATHYGMYLNFCDGAVEIKYNKFWKTTAGQGYGIYLNQCKATVGNPGQVYNNFIHQRGTSGNGYGIYSNFSDYYNFYFNNVHSSHTSTTQSAFRTAGGGTTTLRVKNNIFSNTGGGYAVYIGTTGAIAEIDYNNYWVTGTNIGYWSGARTTLAAFQAVSSGDVNSINLDPTFTDAVNGDLHIGNSALESTGVDIPAIADDFDNNGRPDPPTIGAHELGTGAANDAGATSVDQPTIPFCNGNNDVYVTIRNYGTATLVSATINWEVNGVGQTPFAWTGSVASLAYSTSTNIGSFNFAGQTKHDIKVWTTIPNAVADENTANDTITRANANPALSGTYVIGATGDYNTFTAAIDTLEAHGVCGAITIDVQTGTYTEQVDLQEIPGASAANRITFQSQTGDSTDVELTYALATFADNYIVKLDGADYITFRDMTISSTDPFDNRIIEITNTATFNEFHNNKLMTIAGSNGDEIVHSVSSSRHDSDNVFNNNWFLNGNMGIWFEGPGAVTPRTGGLTIQNNLFETYRYGVYVEYVKDVTIHNNRMINAASSNGPATQGILCRGCDSTLTISKNEITMIDGTNNHGMELLDCVSSVGNPSTISNNMIVAGGTGTSRCIYTNATTNKKFYYNSLLTTGTNTSSSVAFYFNGPFSVTPANNANYIVKNNIFKATNGYAIINSVGGINESDYNDYNSSGFVGGGRGSLGEWEISAVNNLTELQTASSDDANSISIDPLFTSVTDLHILVASPVIDQALVLAEITDDIDGDGRAPDIGADEFLGALPVSILSFSARAAEKRVVLNWETATETNNDYFTVERSVDGESFEEVNRVTGAGTSNTTIAYTTLDEDPYSGVSYYRLKQTDFDGKYDYTNKIAVLLEEGGMIQLFPNPTTGEIQLLINNTIRAPLSVVISNTLGQIVFTTTENSLSKMYSKHIDLSTYAKGIYSIKVVHGNKEQVEKIIVR
jgi:hypothetical protein